MEQFVVRNLQYAFGPDSLETTRAMNTDAGSPRDISALFDRVAYEKCKCFANANYHLSIYCFLFSWICNQDVRNLPYN